MKRIRILSVLLTMFVAIGFTGCQTEPVDPAVLDNNPIDVPGDASFTVEFGGETFEADQAQAVFQNSTLSISGIRGTNGEAVSMMLSVNGEGLYNSAIEGQEILFMYMPNATSGYSYSNINPETLDLNGVVEITEIDEVNHTISGTFSFTGYYSNDEANLPPVVFSNGQFTDLPYTGAQVPEEPGEDPYFTATVNGADVDYSEDTTAITSTLDGVEYITLVGASTTSLESITLNLNGVTEPGTYAIGDSSLDDVNASFNSAEGDSYNAQSGTLTIVSNEDGWIIGTFSFAGVNGETGDVVEVVDGAFKVEN